MTCRACCQDADYLTMILLAVTPFDSCYDKASQWAVSVIPSTSQESLCTRESVRHESLFPDHFKEFFREILVVSLFVAYICEHLGKGYLLVFGNELH